jgi:hypothetical protein
MCCLASFNHPAPCSGHYLPCSYVPVLNTEASALLLQRAWWHSGDALGAEWGENSGFPLKAMLRLPSLAEVPWETYVPAPRSPHQPAVAGVGGVTSAVWLGYAVGRQRRLSSSALPGSSILLHPSQPQTTDAAARRRSSIAEAQVRACVRAWECASANE